MKRVYLLLSIAVVTVAVILLIRQPSILGDIWLWIVGLIGTIIAFFEKSLESIKSLFSDKKEDDSSPENETQNLNNMSNKVTSFPSKLEKPPPPPPEEVFEGIKVSVLRFSDSGNTSVGLLYLNDEFFCYTLEDTFRAVKVKGKTRIPAGIYNLALRKVETPLTLKYRERYPWFTFHLHIQDVPDFSGVYIHSGGDHTHTEGCLLVSDSISVGDAKTFLTNSRNTFKELYLYLSEQLEKGIDIRLYVNDENWFEKHL